MKTVYAALTLLVLAFAPIFGAAQTVPSVPSAGCTRTITVPCGPAVRHPHRHAQSPTPIRTTANVAPPQQQPPIYIPVPVPTPGVAAPPARDEYVDRILAQIAYTNAISTQNATETAKANALAYQLDAETMTQYVKIDRDLADATIDLDNAQIGLIGTQRSVMKWGVAESFFGDATRMAGEIWQPGFNFNNSNIATPNTSVTGPTVTANAGITNSGNSQTGPVSVKTGSVNNSNSNSNSNSNAASSQTGPVNVKTPIAINNPVSVTNPVKVVNNNPVSVSSSNSNQQSQGQDQGQSQSQSQSQSQQPGKSNDNSGGGHGNGKPCPPGQKGNSH